MWLIAILFIVLANVAWAESREELIFTNLSIKRGQELFNGKGVCFACHGIDANPGRVTNAMVSRLNPQPTDLRDADSLRFATNHQRANIIQNGISGTAMVPTDSLNEVEVWDVVAFLNYLVPLPMGIEKQSEHVETREETWEEFDSAIRTECATRWPTDFRMQAYCVNEQYEALKKLTAERPSDIPREQYTIIFSECGIKWGHDFKMRVYCQDQQYEGIRQLRR